MDFLSFNYKPTLHMYGPALAVPGGSFWIFAGFLNTAGCRGKHVGIRQWGSEFWFCSVNLAISLHRAELRFPRLWSGTRQATFTNVIAATRMEEAKHYLTMERALSQRWFPLSPRCPLPAHTLYR